MDTDIVLRAVIELNNYDKAVIISSDGDFYSLAQYLYESDKLETVLSPDKKNCSGLLRQTAREKIRYMDNLRHRLEYEIKKKSTA